MSHQRIPVCSKLTAFDFDCVDQNRPVDTLRTREIIGTMGKKKPKKQSDKETLAEVIKEMAKPRVAESARE
jgi:hypothetical protein